MEKMFRFGIMGAGGIAVKFSNAVKEIADCEVVAVSSKSMERAESFAAANGIPKAYDSYEEMLQKEELDGVYIATTVNAHYELCMLCLQYKMPVICEKAMFRNSAEAREVFAVAEREKVFIMEAMWSRFLPAVRKVKQWVKEERIGKVNMGDMGFGIATEKSSNSRYWDPALCGGAALDVTVYPYELMTYMIEQPIIGCQISVDWNKEYNVDAAEIINLQFADAIATLKGSIQAPMGSHMVLYGEMGKIVLPHAHASQEAFLYDRKGNELEHFIDLETNNGFVYEISEMVQCVRNGKIESETVPHALTIACAELFDGIWEAGEEA